MNNTPNHIFDVTGKKGQAMRGFLDMDTKEIVIYDDLKGKELFRIGGGQRGQVNPAKKKQLTTLTFIVNNGGNTKQTATLFGANFDPLVQPLGISVIIKEIENQVNNSHNYLRKDILANNKLQIVGFSYLVENTQQFNNSFQLGTIKPYGLVETKPFSPLTYLNEYQFNNKLMTKKINWNVDARSVLYIPVEANSKVTLSFDVLEDVDMPLISDYKDGNIKKDISTDAVGTTNSTTVNFDGNNNHHNDNRGNNVITLIALGVFIVGVGLIIKAKMK